MSRYIARIRKSDKKAQSVQEHLRGAQHLAEAIGAKIGVKHITGLAAILHDMGKFTEAFLAYILEAANNPDNPPKKGSVDHATAGGKWLHSLFHKGASTDLASVLTEIVGNAIISHHAYLHDFLAPDLELPYLQRVGKELEEFETAKREFEEQVMSESELRAYVAQAVAELQAYLMIQSHLSTVNRLSFLSKYIFSALIDADRTNSRLFEEDEVEEEQTDHKTLFGSYYEKLMTEIDSYRDSGKASTVINELRRTMSDQCGQFAARLPGIYTLSIPTGGGKTLASLRYALKHALEYGKKRIIYIVPFTTIIEQNAEEVRRIFGDDGHILEHHSNVIDDTEHDAKEEETAQGDDGIANVRERLRLAKDNWDAPIIFTTLVQFLNVFYARSSRDVRRLHNLSESVIIFDEVQQVPVRCVSLFNQALNFLSAHAKSTVVLCTATQPALHFVKHKLDLAPEGEMIQNLDQVIEAFKRVEVVDQASNEAMGTEKLAAFVRDKMGEVRSMLVILNTKTAVRRLFQELESSSYSIYHLSTSMCGAHRFKILNEVREKLKAGEQQQQPLRDDEKVLCISTQLIEAGVDISFDCVVRSLAGLDSIAQAAGRCNRHGKEKIKQVYIINHEEERLDRLREIQEGKKIARQILIDLQRDPELYGGDMLSPLALNNYFQKFYSNFEVDLEYRIRRLDRNMTELLMENRQGSSFFKEYQNEKKQDVPQFFVSSYRTAAQYFEVIATHATSVLAPYGEGEEIITQLNGAETIENLSQLLRKAQRYSVNLHLFELEELSRNGGLEWVLSGKVPVLKEAAYNEKFGVDIGNESPSDFLMA